MSQNLARTHLTRCIDAMMPCAQRYVWTDTERQTIADECEWMRTLEPSSDILVLALQTTISHSPVRLSLQRCEFAFKSGIC